MSPSRAEREAEALFRRHRGVLRTSRALAAGVHPRTLYQLRDSGRLVQESRGVYRLASVPEPTWPDLALVAARVPQAVICLISALAFHEITTQIPHEVQIALPRGTRTPRLAWPPVRVFRLTGEGLSEGIETHAEHGVTLRVYGPEKTIADCFRFRNKVGLDAAVEALRMAHERKRLSVRLLVHHARIDRVDRVIAPYLEMLL